MRISRRWNILLSIITPIAFFFLFTSLVGFFVYTNPTKITSDITPDDLGLQYEEISFTTTDNITLQGWFIPHEHQRTVKTIIALHGWPADKGDILPAISFLHTQYNLLLFDFRGLGQSQGTYSTIGVQETEDLKAAVQYVKSRGIKEIGVWGFSMGGAVALMAAPSTPEIQAIVSDSSYASLNTLASQAFRVPILNIPLGYLASLWAKLLIGVDTSKASPVDSVAQLNIPVLFIHSTNDEVIPFSHAQKLQNASLQNQQAEFWFQENLSHGQLPKDYETKVLEFFKKTLY